MTSPKGQNSGDILVKGSGLTHLGNGDGIESFFQLAKKLRSSIPILTEAHFDKATHGKNLTNFIKKVVRNTVLTDADIGWTVLRFRLEFPAKVSGEGFASSLQL